MRIGLISYEYPPYPGGGIATYVANAARALAAAGHEVHVVTNAATFGSPAPEHRAGVRTQDGIVTHRLPLFDEHYRMPASASVLGVRAGQHTDRPSQWARDPSTWAGLAMADYVRVLHAATPFDVVEVPDMFAEGFFMARRRRCGRTTEWPPVSVLGHTSSRETYRTSLDVWQSGGLQQGMRVQREDVCLLEADGLQTPSRSLLQRYEAWFGPRLPRRRDVVANFFDVPATVPTSKPAWPGDARTLVVIGRVEPRKGSDVALRAFALLAAEFPDLELVFVGEANHWWPGESFAALVADVLPAAVRARVRFPGLLPREQVFAAAAAATLVLHPSRWDNWPNAVLEAMAIGACCVVSDHGGQAEMVRAGIDGEVVPVDDPVALAATIRGLLQDDERRRRLGHSARQRVQELADPQRILAQKLAHFRALATARPAPALPAVQLVVDGDGAAASAVAATIAALRRAFPANRPGADDRLIGHADTAGFHAWQPQSAVPWQAIDEATVVVWVRAGAVPTARALHELAVLASDDGAATGAFLWLAREAATEFPFAADCTVHDLLLVGSPVPTVLAIARTNLRHCPSLVGCNDALTRCAVLAAAANLATDRPLRHTGDVGGHDTGGPAIVTGPVQIGLTGWLELHDRLDQGAIAFGEHQDPHRLTAGDEARQLRDELRARLARWPWPWWRRVQRVLRAAKRRFDPRAHGL
jgi:glycosyltransferase involved in cell wall biosynthesis